MVASRAKTVAPPGSTSRRGLYEACPEVDLVLQAEVRPDWDEQKVRELVTEVLDQYEEDDDGDDDEVDDDDDGEGEFDD